jgi:hypothetical protein
MEFQGKWTKPPTCTRTQSHSRKGIIEKYALTSIYIAAKDQFLRRMATWHCDCSG